MEMVEITKGVISKTGEDIA